MCGSQIQFTLIELFVLTVYVLLKETDSRSHLSSVSCQ